MGSKAQKKIDLDDSVSLNTGAAEVSFSLIFSVEDLTEGNIDELAMFVAGLTEFIREHTFVQGRGAFSLKSDLSIDIFGRKL